jgi:hypothetical protein
VEPLEQRLEQRLERREGWVGATERAQPAVRQLSLAWLLQAGAAARGQRPPVPRHAPAPAASFGTKNGAMPRLSKPAHVKKSANWRLVRSAGNLESHPPAARRRRVFVCGNAKIPPSRPC